MKHVSGKKKQVVVGVFLLGAILFLVGCISTPQAADPNKNTQSLKEFLSVDQTDKHLYIPGEFVCYQYAYTLKENATKNGYRCYVVLIGEGSGEHAINMFYLSDGYLFIEPQTDGVVSIFDDYQTSLIYTIFNSNQYVKG